MDGADIKKTKAGGKRLVLLMMLISIPLVLFLELKTQVLSNAAYSSKKRLVPAEVTLDYGTTSGTRLLSGKDGFLCVTKDGAAFYSDKGETLWNITYTMQAPYAVKNGDSFAILEPMGRTVYVCGPNGLLYIVSAESAILSASLNRINCLITIVAGENGYNIRVYNANGERATERATELHGIVPTAAALSDDGYIYAVGYLDTTKTILSRVLYFYTDSGAKRYGTDDNTPFKAVEYPNSIITRLVFGKNNNLLCVTDLGAFITTARGEAVWDYTLQSRLLDYSFGDTHFGLVLGKPFANALENGARDSALLFDYSGELIIDTSQSENEALSSQEFEEISVYDKYVLLKGGGEYILINPRGKRLWTHGASDDILGVVPLGANRAVIEKNGFSQIYELKLPKADD